MKIDISILMPAIRRDRWTNVYDSISKSTNRNFELIIIGPTPLPTELQNKQNIKYIKEYGNPVRSSQIGSLLAEGKYLFWTSDDGTFQPGALDKLIDALEARKENSIKDVVVANYREGENSQTEEVLKVNVAYPSSPYVPDDWYHFNVALMYTDFFYEIGGYDCSFEACPMAYADIGVRAHRSGANVIVVNEDILHCTHMPGTTGDHAPIHFAHLQNDEPEYKRIYSTPDCVNRSIIDLQNWRQSPRIWDRRFRRSN